MASTLIDKAVYTVESYYKSMDPKNSNIKLEVKEEPEYVYIEETACCVKLEEKNETVLFKEEGVENVVADIGLCGNQQRPLFNQDMRQVQEEQKTPLPNTRTKRKLLPRPQIKVQNLDFCPKAPVKNGSRKILPRPQIVSDVIQLQPLQSAEPTSSKTVQLGAFLAPQPLNSSASLQQMKSIPISKQNMTAVQFQNIKSTGTWPKARPNQALQGISASDVHQTLPVNQLQNIPAVISNQNNPLQQLQNVSVVNSSQQSIQTANVQYSGPFHSPQKTITSNSVQSLQPLSSGGMHHGLPLTNVSSNIMQDLTKVPHTDIQGSLPMQIDTHTNLQGSLPLQTDVKAFTSTTQHFLPIQPVQNLSLQQLQNVHPCTRTAVSFQELNNISTITTQAVSLQGQCILSPSEQQNFPIQAVHPVNAINSCSTLPVQQYQSLPNPVAQQELTSPNPSVIPQQSVPIHQVCASSQMNVQQNISFQQVQPFPQSFHNQLSIQQVCPATLADGHHLVQLQHIQNIAPNTAPPNLPVQQIQTSPQLQPAVPGPSQDVILTEIAPSVSSSRQELVLNQIQSVTPDHSNMEVLSQTKVVSQKRRKKGDIAMRNVKRNILPRPVIASLEVQSQNKAVSQKRRRKVDNNEGYTKKKIIPRPFTAKRNPTPSQATVIKKVARKILPRPLYPAANIALQQPAVLASIAQKENLVNSHLIPVQSATPALNLNYIPISNPMPMDADIPNKTPSTEEEHDAASLTRKYLTLPKQQETLMKKHEENMLSNQILQVFEVPVHHVAPSEKTSNNSDDAHLTTSFNVNENDNMNFLNRIGQEQVMVKPVRKMSTPTAHVSVQTFKNLCEDSDDSCEGTADFQEGKCASVFTSASLPVDGYNHDINPSSLCQEQSYSIGNAEESKKDGVSEISKSLASHTCQEEESNASNNVGDQDFLDQILQAEAGASYSSALQNLSTVGVCPVNEDKYNSADNIGLYPYQLEHVPSSFTDGKESLASMAYDSASVPEKIHSCDKVSATSPECTVVNTDQTKELMYSSGEDDERDVGQSERTSQAHSREEIQSAAVQQQLDQEVDVRPSTARTHCAWKRRSTQNNGHSPKRLSRKFSSPSRNFKSFSLYVQQMKKLMLVSGLKQKLASQELRIRKLEEALEEQRKQNKALVKALFKASYKDGSQVKSFEEVLETVEDCSQELVDEEINTRDFKNGLHHNFGPRSLPENRNNRILQSISQPMERMAKVWSPGVGSDDSEGVR